MLMIFAVVQHRETAESDALDFVRLNGYTNEGYDHNLISSVVERIRPPSNRIPIGVVRLTGVAFPSNRMSDTMAAHLLNIRNLYHITLFPPDPNGSGLDFNANAIARVNSLRDLDLPLGTDSIARIEERFPGLIIQVATRPGPISDTEDDGIK